MKKMMLLCISVCWLFHAYSRTLIVSNIGNTFSPKVTVAFVGDTIHFQLTGIHNAVEVNKANWNANLNLPLGGGFAVPFGGGKIIPNTAGEKYFICSNHIGSGMKGMIIVMPLNTIAYTGFEGAIAEWSGTGIGNLLSTDTLQALYGDTTSGIHDDPSRSRILDGLRSWQVNDRADTLILSSINTIGFDSLNLKLRFTATSINPGQGVDDNDSILVYIALNGSPFHSQPTLVITGDNNHTWGFNADSIIKVQADSFSVYSVPAGMIDTNTLASTANIMIPFSSVEVKVRIIMKNNQNKEVWSMDAITLTGVRSRALPLTDNYLNLEKTSLGEVKITWSVNYDNACKNQLLQRSENGTSFVDIYKVDCADNSNNRNIQYLDMNPHQGYNYYRIKSVNFKGDADYTVIKSISIQSKSTQYRLYPTIATEYINLINSNLDKTGVLQLVSLHGTVLSVNINSKSQRLYIGHLPIGVYKITCKSKKGIEVLSFIKI